jgi:hypothetical protein
MQRQLEILIWEYNGIFQTVAELLTPQFPFRDIAMTESGRKVNIPQLDILLRSTSDQRS